jgi:hypothetical protein
LLPQTDGQLTRELRSEFKFSLEKHAKNKQLGRFSKLERSIELHSNEDVDWIQLARDGGGSCECDNVDSDSLRIWGKFLPVEELSNFQGGLCALISYVKRDYYYYYYC